MIDEIASMMDAYSRWLRDETRLREVGDDWIEISTPHVDRYNDFVQIYARREGESFRLTDDGYTIRDLETSGCTIDTPKRREILQTALNGFGVELSSGALETRASGDDLPVRMHNLIQAMLSVNDMFYLASPSVASLFFEDVVQWLRDNDVRFVEDVKFTGASGLDYMFDFAIPSSKMQPERLINSVNHPDRAAAKLMAFSWYDIRGVRPTGAKAFAILNDTEREVHGSVKDALQVYSITPVPWSDREKHIDELAA